MHTHCQNSVSQELIGVLSWNLQRMLIWEDRLTKRQYVHTTVNTTATAIFTTANTASIATTCRAKSIGIKISRSIWTYRLSKRYISNVISMANHVRLKLPGLDERNVLLTKRQYINTSTNSSIVAI